MLPPLVADMNIGIPVIQFLRENCHWTLLSHSESLNSPNPESSRPQYSIGGPLRAVATASCR